MADELGGPAMPGAESAAQHAGDSGSQTFERYRWQAKMALLSWLLCLTAKDDRPLAVICEYLEDVVVCGPHDFLFAQLKTRDRGSWSDRKVCEDKGALHSLCRTFGALAGMTRTPAARFEMRLEGAVASTKSTAEFFADPRTADAATRRKLIEFGVNKTSIDSFLGALTIRPNQPPRGHIDAVILQTIGATWPSMSDPERIALSLKLLSHVELAQEGNRPFSVAPGKELMARLHELCDGRHESLDGRVLTADDLAELTPPLPGTPSSDLMERAARGEASALELKLRAAGASEGVVTKALLLRAESETRRQEVLAEDDGDAQLLRIDVGLLMLAQASADQAALLGGSNPSIAARPADYVFNDLLSNPQSLLAIDVKQTFDGRFDFVLGYLCHLSDSCRFPWRSQS